MCSHRRVWIVLGLSERGDRVAGGGAEVEKGQNGGVAHRRVGILDRGDHGGQGGGVGRADMSQGGDGFLASLGVRFFQLFQPMGDWFAVGLEWALWPTAANSKKRD